MTRIARLSTLALAGLLVAAPPLGTLLESTMTTHMLVQIPLLALCGWTLGTHVAARHRSWHLALAPFRWAALVVATTTFGAWMIPRLLDLAVESAGADLAKVLSLSLLGGLPLQMAWSHLGPVARGLVHMEALASLWRLGWIYLDSPSRLCSQYGLMDQQRLGGLLLQIGAAYAIWLAWRALAGSPRRVADGTNFHPLI
ncbi:MAG TPA: hypothetical protein VJO99_24805 [Burkholderiaceae bacterium]|nr:hypothetical protein [Burkholderiaceae bacterium]